ncbi:unnamed protein product [Callosobruchus maculatus]|uniref:Uncharacterized protein n=1 Tax=Callosobruchus maculatus TaxID=64391 RepID=A0A653C9H9_CALMS|nr:unnamed protein product [Callosobruchus maculatus]
MYEYVNVGGFSVSNNGYLQCVNVAKNLTLCKACDTVVEDVASGLDITALPVHAVFSDVAA